MEKKSGEKVFIVIDGNGLIHRAYHAMPFHLTNAEGASTGAVYGFFSMLFKVIQEVRPDYLAITFDRPAPTFRKTMYVGYQAHRPKMVTELSDQIKLIHEVLEKIGIPMFEVDGFEADDVIGTLAQKAASAELRETETQNNAEKTRVIIVSADRDMLQLVTNYVNVLSPVTGISKMILYDTEKVREKFGITPSQIVQYKSLVGDASDNYPGVPGIGPKNAMDLLQKYETLDGVYEHIGDIQAKNARLAQKLLDGHDSAVMSRTLAAIVTDVPFVFSLSECDFTKIDVKKIDTVFESYSFNSLRKRLVDIFPAERKEGEPEEEKKKRPNQLKLLN